LCRFGPAKNSLPKAEAKRHFDGMEMAAKITGGKSWRSETRRCGGLVLQKGNRVPVKEITKAAGGMAGSKQAAEEGAGICFPACQHAEHEILMLKQELLPFVQRGNRNAESLANHRDGRIPLKVGNQNGQLETEAVWAVRNQNIGE
jgi:hypothetical protein